MTTIQRERQTDFWVKSLPRTNDWLIYPMRWHQHHNKHLGFLSNYHGTWALEVVMDWDGASLPCTMLMRFARLKIQDKHPGSLRQGHGALAFHALREQRYLWWTTPGFFEKERTCFSDCLIGQRFETHFMRIRLPRTFQEVSLQRFVSCTEYCEDSFP
jgi:hypothetical protein